MQVSDETKKLMPSQLNSSSYNKLNKPTIDVSGSDTQSPNNNAPLSAPCINCAYKSLDLTFNQLTINTKTTAILKPPMLRPRSNSDTTPLINKSKIKKKYKLENLTITDLKLEYIKQRKQRKRDKKHYKRLSRQLHDTITKSADAYEDQLLQNEMELKQEYETKLIEAEIKRNASEQKITALNAEVQRLQELLTYRLVNRFKTSNMHTMQTTGTYMSSRSDTLSAESPLEPLGCTCVDDEHLIELVQRESSMQQKLKVAMLPALKYNEESNLVIFDAYNTYLNGGNDMESDRRKKKKKKSKTKTSFFDFLVKCVTPTMCDQQL